MQHINGSTNQVDSDSEEGFGVDPQYTAYVVTSRFIRNYIDNYSFIHPSLTPLNCLVSYWNKYIF